MAEGQGQGRGKYEGSGQHSVEFAVVDVGIIVNGRARSDAQVSFLAEDSDTSDSLTGLSPVTVAGFHTESTGVYPAAGATGMQFVSTELFFSYMKTEN